ncbi:hypothetical protein [Oxalobacter paraformigenes]|uniref:Uncharacterized protein n=1 Tax=Oxalobacter paraformigenes TaxID=556268 RepID=C3X3S5_9BURK|nr:hypothetical protein [Oxalobacter paraformigenes]EEO27861.1 hypothetical protein OFAG_01014 [Oxalobacter paraformigenes]
MGLKKTGVLFPLLVQLFWPVLAEPARAESLLPPLMERETELAGLPLKGQALSMDEGAAFLGERRHCRTVGNEEGAEPERVATHVFYGQGELWLAKTPASGERAPVLRVLTSRPDVETSRGIAVGMHRDDLLKAYGEPDRLHWNRLSADDYPEVVRWAVYRCHEGCRAFNGERDGRRFSRLVFGLAGNGTIRRVGYSTSFFGL